MKGATRAALAAVVVGMMAVMACEPVAPTPEPPTPAPTAPVPEPQATCDDSAIRLLERGAGIHGAIVDDTLHLGGETAPATCTDPTNEALQSGLSMPDVWTAQVQQSVYYLIVIRYPDGNQLYVVSRRSDGTICMVDLDDECIARVTDLPDDFDLEDLPDDVAPTIPAGRPVAPPAPASPPPPSCTLQPGVVTWQVGEFVDIQIGGDGSSVGENEILGCTRTHDWSRVVSASGLPSGTGVTRGASQIGSGGRWTPVYVRGVLSKIGTGTLTIVLTDTSTFTYDCPADNYHHGIDFQPKDTTIVKVHETSFAWEVLPPDEPDSEPRAPPAAPPVAPPTCTLHTPGARDEADEGRRVRRRVGRRRDGRGRLRTGGLRNRYAGPNGA